MLKLQRNVELCPFKYTHTSQIPIVTQIFYKKLSVCEKILVTQYDRQMIPARCGLNLILINMLAIIFISYDNIWERDSRVAYL